MIEPFDVVHDKQKKRLQEMAYLKAKELEVEELREQNRVLRLEFQSLLNAIDDSYDEDLPVEIVEARNKAQAALTATSQPGGAHEL